jgi:hypothetical protein
MLIGFGCFGPTGSLLQEIPAISKKNKSAAIVDFMASYLGSKLYTKIQAKIGKYFLEPGTWNLVPGPSAGGWKFPGCINIVSMFFLEN